MFRTRDFILLFSAIMFLVMAIGTTLINQGSVASQPPPFEIQAESDVEYVATVAVGNSTSRSERVAQMRSKISQQALILEPVLVEETEEDSTDSDTSTTTDELAAAEVVICPLYRPYVNFWDARDLQLVEREGARVLTRGEISSISVPELVLQLPIKTLPSGNPSCLSSDVVGIANDGSLIRNDEVGLYSIFGSETLLGYALDGFPIYGAGIETTDTCGGVMAASGYRYELSAQRSTIINCFAAAPVLLP
jgi:hypothetical protein